MARYVYDVVVTSVILGLCPWYGISLPLQYDPYYATPVKA